MRILVVGAGRAGGALAKAAGAAGHEIVGLVTRSPLRWDLGYRVVEGAWPEADLILIATRDAEIADTAMEVKDHHHPASAVHLSGAVSLSALRALAAAGWKVGSFHPLQTLPDPELGAKALAGAWVAVTADGELRLRLRQLAGDLGMHDFDLPDEARAAYHAGATSASNFVLAALDLAHQLFELSGVPFAAARPLATAVVANAFVAGPRLALTGPVARQDWGTVRSQRAAAAQLGPQARQQFELLAEATAITAGVKIPEDLRFRRD